MLIGRRRLFACAARKRRIGQRGSQTETMRDMIVLHYPFARSSVAAAFKLQVPARTRDQTEAVARGLAAVPMRQRVAAALDSSVDAGRSSRSGSPASTAARCSLWLGLQIELVDRPDDGLRRRRAQRLRHGPQRVAAMRGLDQDQARRIETESVKAVTMQPAVGAEPVARHDEEEGALPSFPPPLWGRKGGGALRLHKGVETCA